jgi:hypothetical protein
VPTSEYYNRFDPADRWSFLRFLSGRGLQSAELNEVQSLVFDAIKRLSDLLISDGNIVSGCEIEIPEDNADEFPLTDTLIIQEGYIYINGRILYSPKQIISGTFQGEGRESIYVRTRADTTTSADEASLLDPALGFSNYGLPGADREILVPEYYAEDSAPDDAIFFYEIVNGQTIFAPPDTALNKVLDVVAEQNYDENGSYLVSGGEFVIKVFPGDESKFIINLSPYHAYLRGYERKTVVEQQIAINKALTTDDYQDLQKVGNHVTDNFNQIQIKRDYVSRVQRVLYPVYKTVTINRQSPANSKDVVRYDNNDFWEILNVPGYTQDTDWVEDSANSSIDWSPGGSEPPIGTSYSVEAIFILNVNVGEGPYNSSKFYTQYPESQLKISSMYIVVNEIKEEYNKHISNDGGTYHTTTDTVNVVTTDDADYTEDVENSDYTTLITLANDIKVKLNAHLSQSGVHIANDGENVVNAGDSIASDYALAWLLIDDIKTKYHLHKSNETYHSTGDYTNNVDSALEGSFEDTYLTITDPDYAAIEALGESTYEDYPVNTEYTIFQDRIDYVVLDEESGLLNYIQGQPSAIHAPNIGNNKFPMFQVVINPGQLANALDFSYTDMRIFRIPQSGLHRMKRELEKARKAITVTQRDADALEFDTGGATQGIYIDLFDDAFAADFTYDGGIELMPNPFKVSYEKAGISVPFVIPEDKQDYVYESDDGSIFIGEETYLLAYEEVLEQSQPIASSGISVNPYARPQNSERISLLNASDPIQARQTEVVTSSTTVKIQDKEKLDQYWLKPWIVLVCKDGEIWFPWERKFWGNWNKQKHYNSKKFQGTTPPGNLGNYYSFTEYKKANCTKTKAQKLRGEVRERAIQELLHSPQTPPKAKAKVEKKRIPQQGQKSTEFTINNVRAGTIGVKGEGWFVQGDPSTYSLIVEAGGKYVATYDPGVLDDTGFFFIDIPIGEDLALPSGPIEIDVRSEPFDLEASAVYEASGVSVTAPPPDEKRKALPTVPKLTDKAARKKARKYVRAFRKAAEKLGPAKWKAVKLDAKAYYGRRWLGLTLAEKYYFASNYDTITSSLYSQEVVLAMQEAVAEVGGLNTSNPNVDSLNEPSFEEVDTMAQSFKLQEGCFLSSVGLYFQQVPDTPVEHPSYNRVYVCIAEMINGYPSSLEVIAEAGLNLNELNYNTSSPAVEERDFTGESVGVALETGPDLPISPAAGQFSTLPEESIFTFADPVYLDGDKEYALIIKAATPNYVVWHAVQGEQVVGTDTLIVSQPSSGVLFLSSNGSTWTSVQDKDLTYNLYRCEFESAGKIDFEKFGELTTDEDWASDAIIMTNEFEPEDTETLWQCSISAGSHAEDEYGDVTPGDQVEFEQLLDEFKPRLRLTSTNTRLSPQVRKEIGIQFKRFEAPGYYYTPTIDTDPGESDEPNLWDNLYLSMEHYLRGHPLDIEALATWSIPGLISSTAQYWIKNNLGDDDVASYTTDNGESNADITYTTLSTFKGAKANAVGIRHIDPEDMSQPLTITLDHGSNTPSVDGYRLVTVSLATNASGALISTAQNVVDAINASVLIDGFLSAAVKSGDSGAGIAQPMDYKFLSGGGGITISKSIVLDAIGVYSQEFNCDFSQLVEAGFPQGRFFKVMIKLGEAANSPVYGPPTVYDLRVLATEALP